MEYYMDEEENCPNCYYAIGVVGGEIDHHLWSNGKRAKDFYKKPNCTLIKGWMIETTNGEKFAEKWFRIADICDKLVKKLKEGKLSLEKLSKKLPNEI